jgi:tetratricopeptide (TPR) repeat protein
VHDATPRTYVFWVHASTRARFEEAYRGLADRLELPGRHDPKADVLRLVSNWLCNEANGQWTMVVDNVDDVETFFPSRRREQDKTVKSLSASLAAYLPQSRNGSILITSRSRDAAAKLARGQRNVKEVLAMDESQGLQLLRNKLSVASHEVGAVADLLRMLDCMPLAITQAAAYINRGAWMTIAGYLDEFRANDKRRESLLNQDAGDLRRDERASNSVVTTWQMSFERIRQERPSAAELLSLMSFFNPQGIPERTLRRHNRAASVGASENRGEADRTFDEDLNTLHAYSLVTRTTTTTAADTETWEMHALVQFCTRVWLSSFGEGERWRDEFVELMAQEFPNGKLENWRQCQQLLPHAEPFFDTEPASEPSLKAWAQLLTNAAWCLWTKGSYQLAQAIAAKAVTAREQVFGLNNRQTLQSVGILAVVLRAQGKYEEAEKLNWRALEGIEKELGVYHLDTLAFVNNLAAMLQDQGKYEEAEKLSRRALEGHEKELGTHHPSTLTTVSNLAMVLRCQGKYEEAEKLSRQALEGNEKELGIHHASTLTSVYCLAHLLHRLKRYAEAAELYQRAYDGYVQKLGPQHPDTIQCGNNFSALRREAKQAMLAENSRQEDKQNSFIARIISRVRIRD